MPEFFDLYISDLLEKADSIKELYRGKSSKVYSLLKDAFESHWISKDLQYVSPSDFSVLGVDSSAQQIVTPNGGIFYVVRSLALSRSKEYREFISGFDFTSDSIHKVRNIISRMMEWVEHKVVLQALDDGFRGFVLLDGSIYGRMMHLPFETGFTNDRDFLLRYFETLIELLDSCKKENITIIGISKESRTAFFREFLVKEIAGKVGDELGIDRRRIDKLLSLALDNKKMAIVALKALEKEGNDIDIVKGLVEELFSRKPDFQLILNYACSSGYTDPLLLGSSIRWKRAYKRILRDPDGFIRTRFPLSSRDKDFVERASLILGKLRRMPAVISFHLLPKINDTPLRIDIPAWVFGLDNNIMDVGWPEPASVDLDDILKLVSAGYCGLDNYNIWLKAVDEKVKLKREFFESLYLNKFEEVVGRFATERGYRRVRFP